MCTVPGEFGRYFGFSSVMKLSGIIRIKYNRIDLRRICAMMVWLLVFTQTACSQETLSPGATTDDSAAAEAAARQLRIYRDALHQGSSEEIRVDAAVGLLLENDDPSREILLSAMESGEHALAREAVCKALVKSQGLGQTIGFLEVFREPLLWILEDESAQEAKPAAEALLLFDFSEVSPALEQILEDETLARQVHMNAIYALQIRPEPEALQSLIKAMDDPDAEVAKAAEAALQVTLGIPVGTSRSVWSGILVELQQKSPEEIRRARLLRQKKELDEVKAERERWKKLYISALDRQYESLDEAGQGQLILETIESDLDSLRIWAMERASKSPVSEEGLREKILSLLSDSSREVRLVTSKALVNMSALDPASALLDRLETEDDSEVRLAMLEALGEACFFAFSPGSPIELPDDVKIQTLEIAAGYLQSASAEEAIKGAEVVRKLLELNSLGEESMTRHLGLLNTRYQKSLSESGSLRAGLLSNLAHLCGQGGAKEAACDLFEPLFIEAVSVENDPALRLAAVQGLSYVDPVKALELFKEKGLMRDESPTVQQIVIDVAARAGGRADLGWLLEAMEANGQDDVAWTAITSICQRQDAGFLVEWVPILDGSEGVTDESVREVLEIAEQRAVSKKNGALQIQIQGEILSRLVKRESWSSALSYLEKIGYDPLDSRFSTVTSASVLEVLLYSKDADRVALLVQTELGDGDLSETSLLRPVLEGYFSDETVNDDDKSFVLNKMRSISTEQRPVWSALCDSFGVAPVAEEGSTPAAAGESE